MYELAFSGSADLVVASWTIRNGGLMLLKALINRLHGGTDIFSTTAPSSRRRSNQTVYQRYPTMSTVILRLLWGGQGTQEMQAPSTNPSIQTIVPAMEMIEHFGIPRTHGDEIRQAVDVFLGSPYWALRDKAAKARSSCVAFSTVVKECQELLENDFPTQNTLHGRLLALKWLLRRVRRDMFNEWPGSSRSPSFRRFSTDRFRKRPIYFTRAEPCFRAHGSK